MFQVTYVMIAVEVNIFYVRKYLHTNLSTPWLNESCPNSSQLLIGLTLDPIVER